MRRNKGKERKHLQTFLLNEHEKLLKKKLCDLQFYVIRQQEQSRCHKEERNRRETSGKFLTYNKSKREKANRNFMTAKNMLIFARINFVTLNAK